MATELPTAEQVSEGVDLTGKVAIVTGANVGIGKETARVLALRNAHVILACRSLEKGNDARNDILASLGQEKAPLIEVLELDLSSLASIRKFAEEFQKREKGQGRLDLLINNGGAIYLSGRQVTKEGLEGHYGTNHLGPFYLTTLLLPILKRSGSPSAPARVVTVASGLHALAPPELLDVHPSDLFKDPYDPEAAYSFSKYCNVLFSSELNRRLAGSNVVANSLHPGLIVTNIGRDTPREEYVKHVEAVSERFKVPILTIPQGAATTIFAAVSEEGKTGGRYLDQASVSAPREDAHLPSNTLKLWLLSERLVAEFEAQATHFSKEEEQK